MSPPGRPQGESGSAPHERTPLTARADPGDARRDAPSPAGAVDPLAETRAWLERAVIGLNLCPFAKAPHAKGQVRFVRSRAREPQALLLDLQAELATLAQADPARIETTLVVAPDLLADFDAFNDFLDPAEALLEAAGSCTVMLNGGVCLSRQYCTFAGISRGQVVHDFRQDIDDVVDISFKVRVGPGGKCEHALGVVWRRLSHCREKTDRIGEHCGEEKSRSADDAAILNQIVESIRT